MTDETNGRIDNLYSRLERLEGRFEAECAKLSKSREGAWNRAVDLGSKIALPVALIVGGALVNHELRIGTIESSETHAWLRADVTDIKTTLRTVDERLRLIESKVK